MEGQGLWLWLCTWPVCVRFLVFKNSALFSSFLRSSQAWDHKFSLDYDEVDQTDHTFSESISLVLFPRSLCMALCLSLNVSERVQKSSEVSFCHFLPRLAPSRPLFQKIDANKLKPSRRTCHLEHYPFPRGHLFIFWMMVFYVSFLCFLFTFSIPHIYVDLCHHDFSSDFMIIFN